MLLSLLLLAAAVTPGDVYHLSAGEMAACTEDATRLCADTYPDEQKLLVCMKANRAALSPTCLSSFDAGIARRGLR